MTGSCTCKADRVPKGKIRRNPTVRERKGVSTLYIPRSQCGDSCVSCCVPASTSSISSDPRPSLATLTKPQPQASAAENHQNQHPPSHLFRAKVSSSCLPPFISPPLSSRLIHPHTLVSQPTDRSRLSIPILTASPHASQIKPGVGQKVVEENPPSEEQGEIKTRVHEGECAQDITAIMRPQERQTPPPPPTQPSPPGNAVETNSS